MAFVAVMAWGAWQISGLSRGEDPAPAEVLSAEERALREAARKDPADAGSQRALGAYLLEQGRPYEAMWAFQDTLDQRSEDPEARRALAQALIAARLPRQALRVLATPAVAASANPKSASEDLADRQVAAAAYRAMGDPVGVIGVLTAARPAVDTSASTLLDLGAAYEALGSDAMAEAVYQRHLQLAPDNVEGELALSRLALRSQRWQEAFAALERARHAAPDDPRPLYQLGLALLRGEGEGTRGRQGDGATGQTDEGRARAGVTSTSTSRTRNPGRSTPDARSLTPFALFQQVLQLHPDYGPAHLQIGLRRLREGRAKEAVGSLDQAVRTGAGEEARLRLAEALEATGQEAAAAYQRGAYYLQTQQPRQAAREYQRAATLDPGRPDAFLMLISTYVKLEETAKAAETARQGLERHPEEPALLSQRAKLLLMLDNRAAGARLCRRWLERQPDAAEPYRLLGSIEREGRRYAEAVRLCEQAMARDPENAEYCREAARALIGEPTPAHLRRAAALLRRAISLDPRDAEAPLQLGEVLQRLGDLDGARQQYQRSMDRDPTARHGVVALSQLCPRLGKSDRMSFYGQIVRTLHERDTSARALWRRVFQNPEDADAHARLARLLLEAGELEQARHQIDQAVRLRPARTDLAAQRRTVARLLAVRE